MLTTLILQPDSIYLKALPVKTARLGTWRANVLNMHFNSATCHREGLGNANTHVDRWSHFICSICCVADVNGDGFITPEDRAHTFDVFCGDGDDGKICG